MSITHTPQTDKTKINSVTLNGKEYDSVVREIQEKLDAYRFAAKIAKSPRKKPDAAGRSRLIGKNAADVVKQFRYWHGKGELDDYWIYKTYAEIVTETGLTVRQAKTAVKAAIAEGLLQAKLSGLAGDDGKPVFYRRPGDSQNVNLYRVNALGVMNILDPA